VQLLPKIFLRARSVASAAPYRQAQSGAVITMIANDHQVRFNW